MKIKIYLKLFIFFFTIIFSNLTLAFETSVAEKYSEIFTNNILSQSDKLSLSYPVASYQ